MLTLVLLQKLFKYVNWKNTKRHCHLKKRLKTFFYFAGIAFEKMFKTPIWKKFFLSRSFHDKLFPILMAGGFVRETRSQFHQRSTCSFCANSLAPVKYKPKT